MRRRRLLLPMLLPMALMLTLATPALAAGPFTETTSAKGVTSTTRDVGPICDDVGALYDITLTYNSVERLRVFGDGRVHFGFTWAGVFVAEPVAGELGEGGMRHSGNFTATGQSNQNTQVDNGTFTLSLTGRYDDGTRFSLHIVEHFNATPTGAAFFFTHCHE